MAVSIKLAGTGNLPQSVRLPERTGIEWLDPEPNLADVFVATYDSDGNPGWSRRFGTNADDYLTSVAVSPDGVLFVGGFTYGTFPGQPTVGNGDAFVSLVTPP